MKKNTKLQQPFEILTQKFLSKIKYGELTVKFPSGSIKTFKGIDKNYTADLTINNYKFISKILKRKSVKTITMHYILFYQMMQSNTL